MNESEWIEQYNYIRPKYEKLTRKLESLLKEIVERENIKAIFESRTKTVESFKEKIIRKFYGDPLAEMKDFSGIRIILYSLDDIETIVGLIESEFAIDEDNSANKINELEVDRFGYLSLHYVIGVSNSRQSLSEWADLTDLWAEIQIRTVVQHAWASVSHFLDYKSEIDVPKILRRRLFRLSALFEIADQELSSLIQEQQQNKNEYKVDLEEGNTQIEINVDSLRTYIQEGYEPKYWAKYLRENVGVRVEENDWGDLSRDAKLSQYFGLNSIKEIDLLLVKAHGWGEHFISDYFKDLFERQGTTPDDMNVVINGSVTMLIIASSAEKINEEILAKEFGWGDADILLKNALQAREVHHEKKDSTIELTD